jgi:hypothetical protein
MAEAAFLLKTGMSWQEYEESPDWLIRDMMMLLNAEAEFQKTRSESDG